MAFVSSEAELARVERVEGAEKRREGRGMRLLARRRAERKKRFLKKYALCGVVSEAMAYAGLRDNSLIYQWMKVDGNFKEGFEAAKVVAAERGKEKGKKRRGVWVMFYYGGMPIYGPRGRRGEVVMSDGMLMKRLREMKPWMYGGAEVGEGEIGRVEEGWDGYDVGGRGVRRGMCEAEREERRKKVGFLRGYLVLGRVKDAARKAGVRVGDVAEWVKVDGLFARCFMGVKEAYAERLEWEAYVRGVDGKEEVVMCGNKPVLDPRNGKALVQRRYSDELLMFRLRGMKPEMYGSSRGRD
jgi:hypothetical protein